MTPDTPGPAETVETENPKSTRSPWNAKGGAREGAGAKALPPEQKMVSEKISLLPADWGYLALFVDATTEEKLRTPGHLIRAAIAHLRLSTPYGPGETFYRRPEGEARPVSTTPAIAREAKKQGLTKAEFSNQLYAEWKERQT